ncbi:efflux RND transporter periplasmic adaptor subunit [Dokdonella immobilis]|uniref:Membrane fusion protein, multidrug efflux system n=1 Tax=Dokdonella immobilis TaxID=578942 RepID=A0A1I4VIV0_9GAMM|nr:efflux RND transporter periplasmic adaptor subunit [Dokdonella immobilis]SFN01132.1 membrane fusion protein, multidrug efflux system [Dokdonella immobilis]
MSRLTPLLSLSLALIAALAGCSGGSAPAPKTAAAAEKTAAEEGQPVETARVEQGDLTARYAATATLQAEHEAKIVSEVPGTVLELLVEEGDSVRKGQLLARVDATHSRLQLREAEADLQRRKNDVDRGEKLLARKLIAATSHDQAESEYAVRRAEVALARVVVAKSEIRAPFDGVVTRRWIKQGQLLAANDPVFDVADFSDLRADLRVPERDAVALAAGQPVDFTVDALGSRHFDARIERVAPVVDRESGTVKVTVRVDNRDRSLRPGLFTRMDIAFLHLANAVLIPKTAVLGSRDAEIAYVIVDGKAQRTPIRTGYESGKRIQVLDGVSAGAEVVVTGHAALTDGALVQVINAAHDAKIAQARALAATASNGS